MSNTYSMYPVRNVLLITGAAAEGEQCDTNEDCEVNLLCDGNLKTCRKESTPVDSGSFCSTNGRLCQEMEGDCDNDIECAGSLKCGTDNCNLPGQSTWPSSHDCCYQP